MCKVIVKDDCCIGCGACVAIDPANFDFNDEGLSKVINDNVTEDTMNAAAACPVEAILINEQKKETELTVSQEEIND